MSETAKNAVHCDRDSAEWSRIAKSRGFNDLIALKRTFIVPAFVFFLAYHFALAALFGYAPRLAAMRVIGTVNVAYLFALSQFVMGWVIAGLYLVAAARFDALTRDLLANLDQDPGGR